MGLLTKKRRKKREKQGNRKKGEKEKKGKKRKKEGKGKKKNRSKTGKLLFFCFHVYYSSFNFPKQVCKDREEFQKNSKGGGKNFMIVIYTPASDHIRLV